MPDEPTTPWQGLPVGGLSDPTPLTTAALLREISSLEKRIETRLDAMDKAIIVFSDNLTRVPTDTDRAVGNLRELHDEKFHTIEQQFHNVETQFNERDVRVQESATARDTAVAAALQAQKEAAGEQTKSFTVSINKSEQATGEQIVQLRVYLEQATRAINDKIDALKERVDRGEGVGSGRSGAVVDQRASAGEMRGYIAMAVSLIFLAIAVASFALR